jgi:hypothetical protein
MFPAKRILLLTVPDAESEPETPPASESGTLQVPEGNLVLPDGQTLTVNS